MNVLRIWMSIVIKDTSPIKLFRPFVKYIFSVFQVLKSIDDIVWFQALSTNQFYRRSVLLRTKGTQKPAFSPFHGIGGKRDEGGARCLDGVGEGHTATSVPFKSCADLSQVIHNRNNLLMGH